MIKRLTWFLGGAVAGAVGSGVAKRKVKRTAAQLAPARLARRGADRARDAFGEGRRAMRSREDELRARLAGAASHPDDAADGPSDPATRAPQAIVAVDDERAPRSPSP